MKVLENVQYVMWQIPVRKTSILFKLGIIIIVLTDYKCVPFLVNSTMCNASYEVFSECNSVSLFVFCIQCHYKLIICMLK